MAEAGAAKAVGGQEGEQVIAGLRGKGRGKNVLRWCHEGQQLRISISQKLFLLKSWQHITWLYQNIKYNFKVVVQCSVSVLKVYRERTICFL